MKRLLITWFIVAVVYNIGFDLITSEIGTQTLGWFGGATIMMVFTIDIIKKAKSST